MNSLRQISSWMRHTHTRSKSTLLCRCPRPNDHTRMRSRSICIMGTKEEMLDDCSSHEMKLLVRWERWMKKKIGLIKQYPLHVVYYMIFIYTVVVLKNRMIYVHSTEYTDIYKHTPCTQHKRSMNSNDLY